MLKVIISSFVEEVEEAGRKRRREVKRKGRGKGKGEFVLADCHVTLHSDPCRTDDRQGRVLTMLEDPCDEETTPSSPRVLFQTLVRLEDLELEGEEEERPE